MADGHAGPLPPPASLAAAGLHPRLARIVGIHTDGRALVCVGGPPTPASTLGPVSAAELEQAAREQRSVVVAFLDGRADAPVLLSLHGPTAPEPEPELEPEPEPEVEVSVDGAPQVIEAEHELVLRCGAASITLRADGTVNIRGRDVTSWARRRQRIRGGSVSIN